MLEKELNNLMLYGGLNKQEQKNNDLFFFLLRKKAVWREEDRASKSHHSQDVAAEVQRPMLVALGPVVITFPKRQMRCKGPEQSMTLKYRSS